MKGKRVLVGAVIGIVVLGGLGCFAITKDIPTLKALPINEVDITKVPDGEYEGTYEFSRWKSQVKVVVENGVLTNIERLSEPLIPDVSDQLFGEMIKSQTVEVDTVTGATATSKAYMKSVENALSDNEN